MSKDIPGPKITVSTKTAPSGASQGGERQFVGASPGPGNSTTPTHAFVEATHGSQQLFDRNPDRYLARAYNDSTQIMYVREGTDDCTPSNYAGEPVLPGGTYYTDAGYIGAVQCCWAADDAGRTARTTEYT